MRINKKKDLASIIAYSCFVGILIAGIAIIFCVKINYVEPLLFTGIAISDTELNIKFFRVTISIGIMSLFIEMLFIPFEYIFLRRVSLLNKISIIAFILTMTNLKAIGETNSALINWTGITWFVARFFIVLIDIEQLAKLLKSKQTNKLTKITEYYLERKAKLLSLVIAFLISGALVIIGLTSKDEFPDQLVLFCMLPVFFLIIFELFTHISSYITKSNYKQTQQLNYSGTYEQLITKLSELGFVMEHKAEHYTSFTIKNFLFADQTIIANKKDNHLNIMGNAKIIDMLIEDLDANRTMICQV